jgi:hypothetical protein
MAENAVKNALKTMVQKVEIEPARWYTLYEIAEGGFFRGYQAAASVRRIILADKNKKNILQTIVQGDANGRRYGIKGENIITFLKVWETGEYQL